MILRLCFLGSFLIITDAFQIFGRNLPILQGLQFGFDFPGFTDPSAFGQERSVGGSPIGGSPIGNMEERVDGIMNGMGLTRPGTKIKVKDERKGNMKVHTVEQNGKGFHTYSRLTTYDHSKNGSGNATDIEKEKYQPGPFGAFGPFGGLPGGLNDLLEEEEFGSDDETLNRKKKRCSGSKACFGDSYCDPLENTCKDRLDEGESCTVKDQCKKGSGIICLWGKCSKGNAGEPGCFCSKNLECSGDACCNLHSDISVSSPICTPKLGEGSTCGQSNPLSALTDFFGVKKIESDVIKGDMCNPCHDRLKCAVIGSFGRKVCVPADLKETPTKTDKTNNDKELEEQEKAEEDDKSGSAESAEGPTELGKPDYPEGENKPIVVKPVPPIKPPSEPKKSPPNEPSPSNPEKPIGPKPNPISSPTNSRPFPMKQNPAKESPSKPPSNPQLKPLPNPKGASIAKIPEKKPSLKRPKTKSSKKKHRKSG